MKIKLFLFLFCFLSVLHGFAQIESDRIDFETQQVLAWGLAGVPWEDEPSHEEERSRAWMDALHHAYESVLQVPVMEGVEVKSALQANPALRERLGHLLLTCEKTFYEPDISGLLRCRITVPFSGAPSLRSTLFLAALRPAKIDPFRKEEKIATPAKKLDVEDEKLPWDRLVLDLRKQYFEPSLFPRFFSPTGKLLFQEAKVPGPKRFSRPAVRFSTVMAAGETNIAAGKVHYLAAIVSPLARRDIRILAPDADIFTRFCRRIELEPDKAGEILIIYRDQVLPSGLLPKEDKKEKESKGDSPGMGRKR